MSDIKKNYIYNMAYQVLQMIMPLITAPYVSRVLGADGVGIYSYTHSVAYYFLLVAMLGVNNYGNRSIAQVRQNQEKVNVVFSSIFQVQLLTSFISFVTYVLWILFSEPDKRLLLWVQFIYVLSAALDINWLFFGLEKFKITVMRKAIVKVLTAIMIFAFVRKEEDVIVYAVIMNVGYFISQCYLWLCKKKYVSFKVQPFSAMVPHLRPMIILFVPVFATSIYRVMDKIMIGQICTVKDVGIYENADKIIVVCLGIVSALGTVMLPRISNLYANNRIKECKEYYRKSIHFIMFITVALAFGIASVSEKFVVIFYGNDFAECGKVLAGLAFSLPFIGVSNTTRNQVLIPKGEDEIYLKSVIAGACTNLTSNMIFMPKYGVIGAVIGTLLAECVVAVFQIFSIRRIIELKIYIKDNIIYFAFGLFMFACVKNFLEKFDGHQFFSIIIAVVMGASIYICLSVVYWIYTRNFMWKTITAKLMR